MFWIRKIMSVDDNLEISYFHKIDDEFFDDEPEG